MYRIIAYHGKGKNRQVKNDLRLFWDSVRGLTSHGRVQHIYCFQAVSDKKGAYLLVVLQYGDNVATKLALHGKLKLASQLHNHVDFWFYIRDRGALKC